MVKKKGEALQSPLRGHKNHYNLSKQTRWRSPSTCGSWTHAEDKAFTKGMYAGPVDVVFLWANSTDPAYYTSKQATMEKYNHTLKWMRHHKKWSMTKDNGELRISVQLVLQNMPWVRYVYIVSNGGQRPGWGSGGCDPHAAVAPGSWLRDPRGRPVLG